MSHRFLFGLINGWDLLTIAVIAAIVLIAKIANGSGRDPDA